MASVSPRSSGCLVAGVPKFHALVADHQVDLAQPYRSQPQDLAGCLTPIGLTVMIRG